MRSGAFFIILGLIPAISGCGVKGDPIPYVNTQRPPADESANKAPPPGDIKKGGNEAK